jgi:hypothetical protein
MECDHKNLYLQSGGSKFHARMWRKKDLEWTFVRQIFADQDFCVRMRHMISTLPDHEIVEFVFKLASKSIDHEGEERPTKTESEMAYRAMSIPNDRSE